MRHASYLLSGVEAKAKYLLAATVKCYPTCLNRMDYAYWEHHLMKVFFKKHH